MEFVLASESPRRYRILSAIGFSCDVVPARLHEKQQPGESPVVYARRSAQTKYDIVRRDHRSAVIIAADTIVCLGGERFGKPHDRAHAEHMLTSLSSRWHRVITALIVGSPSRTRASVTQSLVKFRTISAAEIALYLSTGEPMDKAGAYGLQGVGSMLIETIQGSWTNVAGFPLESFFLLVEDILDAPWTRYARARQAERQLWP